MAPLKDSMGSREGLLRQKTGTPLRPSLEEAYRSSSEDESLDELDLLNDQSPRQFNTRKPYNDANTRAHSNTFVYEKGTKSPGPRGSNFRRMGRFCRPRRRCLIIILIVVAVLVAILAGSGFWVYKKSPADGVSSPNLSLLMKLMIMQQSPPWYPSPRGGTDPKSWQESYQKAEAMVKKMTLVEMVNITTGTGWSQDLCVGNTAPANSVGFPPLCLQDGPLGIRFADHSTAFPAAITVGATWNKILMYNRGRAHGLEAKLKGINVLLGPSMGPLGRMPAGGRNWEGFGPDPALQGIAASKTIRGIQDEGVMATAKHYIVNEQEHFRQSFEWGLPNALSSNVDDRTLHELYLWPFAESIKAGVASVMCSYNMVNNSYACGNSKLLNGILKDELGFQGFVQSDWLAQRSGVASALAGLDMTMPGDGLRWMDGKSLFGPHLTTAVLNGSLPMERIHDMATRVVAAWYQLGQDDKARWPAPPPEGDGGPNFSSWTDERIGKIHEGSDDKTTAIVNKFVDVQGEGEGFHGRLAQQIAAEGTVLVKNQDNILPLSRHGSVGRDGSKRSVKYRVGIFGEDAGPGKGPNACPDRGCNQGTLASGWGSGAVEFPYLVTPLKALESAFDFDSVAVEKYLTNKPSIKKAPSIVEDQDLCIVFINSDAGEGFIAFDGIRGDRNDLYSQKGGDDLVKNVASNCGKGHGDTVVVVHAVGPVVLERWIDLPGVKGVLLANLPGEESGNALVDVLFGDIDASGRLPYTVGKSLADYGEGGQILYYPNGVVPQQSFTEGLYIDYRHFDKNNITPRYEFGYGLSYTTFSFSNLILTPTKPKSSLPSPRPSKLEPPKVDPTIPEPSTALFPEGFRKLKKYVYPYISSIKDVKPGRYPYPLSYQVQQPLSEAGGGEGGNPSLFEIHLNATVTLTNTGTRKGQEVAQLYVSFPSNIVEELTGEHIDFPVRVLRAFEKVELEAGESVDVTMSLTRKDLSYWSVVRQNWVMPTEGQFTVSVGRSSRDLVVEGVW